MATITTRSTGQPGDFEPNKARLAHPAFAALTLTRLAAAFPERHRVS